MQIVSEVAPKHYAFFIKTAAEVKQSPFHEEVISELDNLIKTAINWGSVGNNLKAGAGTAGKGALTLGAGIGTAVAGGIAVALAGDMYDALKRGITKGRNYKSMLEANPQLQKMPAKEVQKAFSVLHHFNPDFASDPTVAGAWVKSRVSLGSDDFYADAQMLKNLVDARKNITDTKKLSPFRPEKEKKGPQGLSKEQFFESMNGLHDRFSNFESNMYSVPPMYPSPGGGTRTTP